MKKGLANSRTDGKGAQKGENPMLYCRFGEIGWFPDLDPDPGDFYRSNGVRGILPVIF
jgi:hypothetical protein